MRQDFNISLQFDLPDIIITHPWVLDNNYVTILHVSQLMKGIKSYNT